jgi:hypothetical protein
VVVMIPVLVLWGRGHTKHGGNTLTESGLAPEAELSKTKMT